MEKKRKVNKKKEKKSKNKHKVNNEVLLNT